MNEFDIDLVKVWRKEIKEMGYSDFVSILDNSYVFIIHKIPTKGKEEEFIDIVTKIQNLLETEASVNNYKLIFNDYLRFEYFDCSVTLNLSHCVFCKGLLLKNCTFHKAIYFSESEFHGNTIRFKDSEFLDNVRYDKCHFFKTANFENAKFEKLVDFYYAVFEEPQKFFRVDILDVAIFTGVKFIDQCQFIYCKVNDDSRISFDSAEFCKSLDISRANFNCVLNFWNVNISNNLECVKDNYWLYCTDDIFHMKNTPGSSIIYKVALKKLRESLRIVKNTYRISGNNIDAARFNKKELEIYELEIKCRKKIRSPNIYKIVSGTGSFTKKICKNVNNENTLLVVMLNLLFPLACVIIAPLINIIYILLRLYIFTLYPLMMLSLHGTDGGALAFNKVSSDYGTNWGRSFWFIIVYSLLFYSLLNFTIGYTHFDLSRLSESLRDYVEFINITNWKLTILENKSYSSGYIVLFIGRIFIAYGYYQLIQAFRKYGRN